MDLAIDILIKLGMAVLIGGLIGAEREFRDKSAGFRTIIFIAIGATLFTSFSSLLAGDRDPTRIAANIVTGIGFLGAGAILREGKRIAGLTTASTIWLTAALGMGIGGGYFWISGIATIITLMVLWVFPRLEHAIDNVREVRTYRMHLPQTSEKNTEMEEIFSGYKLRVFERHLEKTTSQIISSWTAQGRPENHEKFVKAMLKEPEIEEFNY